MTEYTIQRSNAADLVFTGERIGYGEYGGSPPGEPERAYWTKVSVYRTEGGRYVASVERGASDRTPRFDAFIADNATAACNAVIANDHGRIGRATRTAIEQAATQAPEVMMLLRESVDGPRAPR